MADRVNLISRAAWPVGLVLGFLSAGLGGCAPTDNPAVSPSPAEPQDAPRIEPIYVPEDFFACLAEVSQIQYVPDPPGEDSWQTPEQTVRRGRGDCEDVMLLFQDRMRRKGYAVDLVFGLQHAGAKHGHVWCEMDWQGRRLIIEPRTNALYHRDKLPALFYIPVHDLPIVAEKVTAYHARTGRWVSSDYTPRP